MSDLTDYVEDGTSDDHNGHDLNNDHHDHERRLPSVLRIGRKDYAYGLHWTPDSEASSEKDLMRDAKAECDRVHCDLYCTIPGGYGVGSRRAGQSVGMRVLAGCLIDVVNSDLLAAIPVDGGGFYILAVNTNTIDEDSDLIVETEEAARDFILSMIGDRQWTVLAPDEWGIEGSIPDTLVSLVEQSRSKIVLRDATTKTRNRRMLAGLSLIVALSGGYYWYTAQIEGAERARQQQEAQNRLLDNSKKKKQAIQAESQKDWPFDGVPYGVWSILACENAISSVPAVLPDYLLTSVTCNAETMHVQTRFQADKDIQAVYSDVADYLNLMTDIRHYVRHDNLTITVDYDFSKMISDAPLYPKHDKTMSVKEEWSYLDTVFDRMRRSDSLKVSIDDPKDADVSAQAKKMKAKKSDPSIPVTVFKKMKIQISDDMPPENYAKILAPLKAFTVQSVQYSPSSSHWTLNGIAYEAVVRPGR